MAGGRPRTVSLPPDQMIELGKEMVEWVKINKPLHLSAFYCIEKGFTDREWDTFYKRPEFVNYYEKALKMIGMQYLDKNSNIRDKLADRFVRFYFKDYRDHENERCKFEADLKRKGDDENREATADILIKSIQKAIDSKNHNDSTE